MLARPPLGNEDSREADNSKAAKDQDKALTRSKDQDKASKDEELQTKKERLKNIATINNVEPNLENDAAPIRSDVDLSEERPEDKAARRSSSCETSADSGKEFVQTPHSILKTQTKPEFEGKFLSCRLLMFDVVGCLKKLALYFFDTQCVATRKYGGKLWPLLPTGDR